MRTIRMTTAQAIVRWLVAQRTVVDGVDVPLFPGVFAIFGHGNVTNLGQALEELRDELPTWRGQNEQGMALAAVAYAKAMRRRQVMVATSSIGPGALNMVTAAGVAMANRIPLLLLAGDTFASRIPDPVLQQVEHAGAPATTVNDAFRPVVRYWDRITHPAQLVQSLPAALTMMLDPGDCGPAFLALPQDVQADAYEFPAIFFERTVHTVPRPRPGLDELGRAAELLRAAQRPLVIAGGGVHYSLAEDELARFVLDHRLPAVETVAGKSSLVIDHPCYVGPIGVTGADAANRLAAEADVVLAVGTRFNWVIQFGRPPRFAADLKIIHVDVNPGQLGLNRAVDVPIAGDARAVLQQLTEEAKGKLDPKRYANWTGKLRVLDAEKGAEQDKAMSSENTPIHPLRLCKEVRDFLKRDAILVVDGQEILNFGRQSMPTFAPGHRLNSGPFGMMGVGMPFAVGAKVACPDKQVICVHGDGSFGLNAMELDTAIRHKAPLLVVISLNGGWTADPKKEKVGRDLGYTRYDKMAEALGGYGEFIEKPEDIGPALVRAQKKVDEGMVALVNVKTDDTARAGTVSFSSHAAAVT